MSAEKRKHQAKVLRIFRKVHRLTGAFLFVFFFFISITGLLLGWKKHSGGYLLPKSYQGTSTDLKDWLPIDSLYQQASKILHDSVDANLSSKIDRIDIRQDKGMVKFIFKEHYWGLQLDGATGDLLHIERRRSDFIEKIHDGSILDELSNNRGGEIKLIYTTVTGLALLMFTITGFWLWYGPKRMRNNS
jgi:uncharacterized iron-regulated membrane protein